MTPTPEMIAMAERIEREVAAKVYDGDIAEYRPYFDAALTAIMETQALVEKKLNECCEPCPQCHDAIRNGEHLR